MALKFSDMLGQETAKTYLRQVMMSGKIPHAYLFTGISGIGKTTTAMAFAMALNCRQRIDWDACGSCASCRQFTGKNFPDFLSLSIPPDKQKIVIEQIKALNRSLGFSPVAGGYRVTVIHQAESMTEEAANSFLKTLEEPPPQNILILKVREPLDLLPTIVSRCQQVPFKPLPPDVIRKWLIEKKGVTPEDATLLTGLSKGSPGRAIRMAESGFLENRKKWLEDLMHFPVISKPEALVTALAYMKEGRKKKVDSVDPGETGILEMLYVWCNWYRDLLLLRVGGSKDLLMNNDFSVQLGKIAARFSVRKLIDSIMAIQQAHSDICSMRKENLVMAQTVMKLQRFAE